MFYTLLTAGSDAQASSSLAGWGSVIWLVLMVAIFYFLLIRPQKKQQKEQEKMMAELKPGVSIMTTSGFYGVVLDVVDDTVIVEFGNNKNCRIPMNKAAVAQIDRPEEPVAEAEEPADEKKEKKSLFGKKKED